MNPELVSYRPEETDITKKVAAIMDILFPAGEKVVPQVIMEGIPVAIRVPLLDLQEKKALGIDSQADRRQRYGIGRENVALLIDQERNVIASFVVPEKLIKEAGKIHQASGDGKGWIKIKHQVVRDFMLQSGLVSSLASKRI